MSGPAVSATTSKLSLLFTVRQLVRKLGRHSSEPACSPSIATSDTCVNDTPPEPPVKKGRGGGSGGRRGGGGGGSSRGGNGAAVGANAPGSKAGKATNLQKPTRDFSFSVVFLAVALMFA